MNPKYLSILTTFLLSTVVVLTIVAAILPEWLIQRSSTYDLQFSSIHSGPFRTCLNLDFSPITPILCTTINLQCETMIFGIALKLPHCGIINAGRIFLILSIIFAFFSGLLTAIFSFTSFTTQRNLNIFKYFIPILFQIFSAISLILSVIFVAILYNNYVSSAQSTGDTYSLGASFVLTVISALIIIISLVITGICSICCRSNTSAIVNQEIPLSSPLLSNTYYPQQQQPYPNQVQLSNQQQPMHQHFNSNYGLPNNQLPTQPYQQISQSPQYASQQYPMQQGFIHSGSQAQPIPQ